MSTPGHGVRTRLYVAGRLVHEQWADTPATVDDAAREQALAAQAAAARDELWLAEMYDPEAPEGMNRIRFGTDASMMRDPIPQPDVATFLATVARHPLQRFNRTKAALRARRN